MDHIIGFNTWLSSDAGQYLLEWEQQRLDKAVEDLFGYHAIQIGIPALQALKNNRIAHQWLLENNLFPLQGGTSQEVQTLRTSLICGFDALPFADQSIDLAVLPHTLDVVSTPHATLREVQRILVPEGRLVITGFNPASLWGFKQKRMHFFQKLGWQKDFLPLPAGSMIGYWRLRDWLKLLGLEIVEGHFGCYRPAFKTQKWLQRASWMEHAGDRWWPILGAVYELTAVKRVTGMHLVGPAWKNKKRRQVKTAPVAAQRQQKTGSGPTC